MTTFCTCVFKVDNVHTMKTPDHKHQTYLQSLIKLSEIIDNMFIWCDKASYDYIQTNIKCKHYYIHQIELHELNLYEKIKKTTQDMTNDTNEINEYKRSFMFSKNNTDIAYKLNAIFINKLFILQDAIQKDLYNTDMFVWIDAGILSRRFFTSHSNYKNKLNCLKYRNTAFFISDQNSHNDAINLFDSKPFKTRKELLKQLYTCCKHKHILVGTLFIFNKNFFNKFFNAFITKIHKLLDINLISYDETLYFLTCQEDDLYKEIEFGYGMYYNIAEQL